MRIIAGRYKGAEIKAPKNASTTRPTTDRTKEAIFSHLEAQGVLDNARIADIFAGTGALGFESLSRGATSVTFVEAHSQIATLIAQTAHALPVRKTDGITVKIQRTTAEKFAQYCEQNSALLQFDVIFMDPPYAVSTELMNELVEKFSSTLSDDGIMVVERSGRSSDIDSPDGYEIYLRKDYGETAVFYLRKK